MTAYVGRVWSGTEWVDAIGPAGQNGAAGDKFPPANAPGDTLTWTGSEWEAANPDARHVKKSGDTMTGDLVVPHVHLNGPANGPQSLNYLGGGIVGWQVYRDGGGAGNLIVRRFDAAGNYASDPVTFSTDGRILFAGQTNLVQFSSNNNVSGLPNAAAFADGTIGVVF